MPRRKISGIFRGGGAAVGDVMDLPVEVGAGGADDADDLPGGDLLADGQVGLDKLVAVAVDVLSGADFAVVAFSSPRSGHDVGRVLATGDAFQRPTHHK